MGFSAGKAMVKLPGLLVGGGELLPETKRNETKRGEAKWNGMEWNGCFEKSSANSY